MTMGNAIKACLGRCHDNIAGNEFSSDDLRTNWFMSEGNLSYDSSIYSQSTLNEPSVLSFKMIGRNSCVYLDGDVCKICLEEYDDEQRKPYILPCGHTFCVLCLRTLSKRRRFKSIRCPIDRETLYISSRHSKVQAGVYSENSEIVRGTEQNFHTVPVFLQSEEAYPMTLESRESWYADLWIQTQILKSIT